MHLNRNDFVCNYMLVSNLSYFDLLTCDFNEDFNIKLNVRNHGIVMCFLFPHWLDIRMGS